MIHRHIIHFNEKYISCRYSQLLNTNYVNVLDSALSQYNSAKRNFWTMKHFLFIFSVKYISYIYFLLPKILNRGKK